MNKPIASNRNLENQLIDYYQSQSVNSEELNSIIKVTQARRNKRWTSVSVAASLLLMAMSFFLYQNKLENQRTERVLNEIALNHASKLRMDAVGVSLSKLQSDLPQLNFEMRLPDGAFFENLIPLGGRLCTINGNLAAHLKLHDPDSDRQYSLFLTQYAHNLKTVQSPEKEISGVDVKLWQENELVYAFVKAPS